jgi:hypothetical protein
MYVLRSQYLAHLVATSHTSRSISLGRTLRFIHFQEQCLFQLLTRYAINIDTDFLLAKTEASNKVILGI